VSKQIILAENILLKDMNTFNLKKTKLRN